MNVLLRMQFECKDMNGWYGDIFQTACSEINEISKDWQLFLLVRPSENEKVLVLVVGFNNAVAQPAGGRRNFSRQHADFSDSRIFQHIGRCSV